MRSPFWRSPNYLLISKNNFFLHFTYIKLFKFFQITLTDFVFVCVWCVRVCESVTTQIWRLEGNLRESVSPWLRTVWVRNWTQLVSRHLTYWAISLAPRDFILFWSRDWFGWFVCLFLLLLLCCCCCFETGSLCSPGWPYTYYVVHVSHCPPVLVSQVLVL